MAYDKIKDENYKNLGGINTHVSKYQTEQTQFLNLRNYCFVNPGALSSRPGTVTDYTLAIATFATKPTSNIQYTKNDGASYSLFDSGPTLYSRSGFSAIAVSLGTGLIDSVIQNDYLYFANGNQFYRFGGSLLPTVYWNSVDSPNNFGNTFGVTFNLSLIPVDGLTAIIPSGTHQFMVGGYRNTATLSTVFMGKPLATNPGDPAFNNVAAVLGATVVGMGRWRLYGINYLSGYGISAASIYHVFPGQTSYSSSEGYLSAVSSTFLGLQQTLFAGATLTFVDFDNFTQGTDVRAQTGLNLHPKYLETYNNMLFMSGMTSAPSTVWNSNIGTPEQVDDENSFEVRSSNGDFITGMAVFQDSLIVFKKGSVHEVTGSSPDTLSLRDVSLEYGCLGNRGICVFENRLWFIDQRGIVEYNGANFSIVSEPIDSYLSLVDKTKMTAVHVKKKNQVWFASSSTVFVFDYLVGGWSIYDRLAIERDSGMINYTYGASTQDVTWWESGASYHNSVRFGDTLTTDQGLAITLIAQTRFHKRMGESTQELWRRFYINASVPGATQGVTLNLIPNYGSSVYATSSVFLDYFQKRLDFGVSARSLSIEITMQTTQAIKINGYTVESRYLRSV